MGKSVQIRVVSVASLLFGLLLGLSGCSSATGDKDRGVPGVEFLTGTPQPDTVIAAESVIVALRYDDGSPVVREPITFETTGDGSHAPFLFLYEMDGEPYRPSADSTGADGTARVLVLRGTVAGIAWLRVRVPRFNLSDSVPFQIRPGAPAAIRVTPPDTALQVGKTFTIRASVVDRFDNPRSDPLTFTAESSAISVSPSGETAVVTGLTYGRASMRVTGADQAQRGWVSVVPVGTLAFYLQAPTTGDSTGIGLSSTDGAELRMLFASPFDYASDRPLDWAPDGQSLVFHLGRNGVPYRLYRITLSGEIARIIAQGIGGGLPEMLPRYGPDGRIYFTLETNEYNGTDELWRVNPDGSSPERIGPPADPYQSDTYAAPAPDTQHVWFSTDRPAPGVEPTTLAVLRVDSGTVSFLGFYGIGAVWSPLGNRVAFINRDGAIVVANPDGGGQRVVSSVTKRYVPYIDWSPDGKWIVASWRPSGAWTGGMDIIEPDLGMTLPLPFAAQWMHPTWRP